MALPHRRIALFIFGGLASLAVMAGAAWACSADLSLDPTVPLAPDTARPGAAVTVKGTGGNGATEVQVLWDRVADQHVLATVAPGVISVSVIVPVDASPGLHLIQLQGVDRRVIEADGNPKVVGAVQVMMTVEAGPPVVSTDPPPGPQSPTINPPVGQLGDPPMAIAPDPRPGGSASTATVPDPVPGGGSTGSGFSTIGRDAGVTIRPRGIGSTGQPADASVPGPNAPVAGPNRPGNDLAAAAPAGAPPGSAATAGATGGPPGSPPALAGGFSVGAVDHGFGTVPVTLNGTSERTASSDLWSGFGARAGNQIVPSLAGGAATLTDHGAMTIGFALLVAGLALTSTAAGLAGVRRRRASTAVVGTTDGNG